MKIEIRKYKLFLILFIIGSSFSAMAQGFLHADGKEILNGNNENFILRGIGTGNWMLQEGYMMKSSGIAGTQHEFKSKLIETIGEERTEEFYESWLTNHFSKIDVDSMAAWGFNSVRVALHYKWFTLPIEDEPVEGENTWLTKGFAMTDSLLSWCEANQMYLILDLHGAPGGQGKNSAISDYDDSKPSLWESDLNKDKTVALWRKFAERYSEEEWIGGYDLINEVNWTFPEGNNSQLRDLYGRITSTIREVDNNHIIFIEGNGYANDFSGLTPPWDNNMVYSFHKYWNYNDDNSLDWVIQLRDNYNVPLWLGETGENSNTWFTNLVALSERKNIGWSWWPVKKSGINNILKVETNQDYKNMIEMWKGNGSMTAEAAYQAVMTFSENHKFENNTIQYDVIDALIRQPYTNQTIAFKPHTTNQTIFAVDYDLGRNNFAYFDLDTADYHLNTSDFGAWNTGWQYRSDGVDIEACTDVISNGYSVGWIKEDEWLQYTINSEAEAAYNLQIRYASDINSNIHIEINGKIATESVDLPRTGAWNNWQIHTLENVILPQGEVKVKIVFENDGFNFNYFSFTEGKPVSEIPFEFLSATTHQINNEVSLNLNKPISTDIENIIASDFQIIINNSLASIKEIGISEDNNQQIILIVDKDLFSTDNIKLSYIGSSIFSDSQDLSGFIAKQVENKIHPHFEISDKIEAEDFFFNNGFQLEECFDYGGGQNTGYADDGDYLDYLINVPNAGTYKIDFRVAVKYGTPEILLMNSFEDRIVVNKSVKFQSTGGWQSWETQSSTLTLPAGKIIFRIYSRSGEHNLNWFTIGYTTNTEVVSNPIKMIISPNPASKMLKLEFNSFAKKRILLYSMAGKQLVNLATSDQVITLDIRKYPMGNYVIQYISKGFTESFKVQITR